MDWVNERYARVYTRDTTTWKLLDWRARCLLVLLLRKVDRVGVLEVGCDGVLGLAAQVELPLDLTEAAIAQLVARGIVVETTDAYVIPNFLEAQEAVQTEAHRSREYRARKRDKALSVTKRDSGVTKRDETVTPRHSPSRGVTERHSYPDRTVPDLAVPNQLERVPVPLARTSRGSKSKAKTDHTETELASVRVVLDRLSERSGVQYTGSVKHTALIVARLRDGTTEWDLRRVIGYCADRLGWQDKPDMRPFLRPETLFGPQTIEKYLDPARTWESGPAPTEQPIASGERPQLRLVETTDPSGFDFTGPEHEENPWTMMTSKIPK